MADIIHAECAVKCNAKIELNSQSKMLPNLHSRYT